MQYLVLGLLVVLLYSNTLHHGFVLDDDVVILRNNFVQKGIQGIPKIFSHDSFAGFERIKSGQTVVDGGRYRPLSLAFFAIIHSLFGNNPLIFHAFSIFLFVACAWILLTFFSLLLKDKPHGQFIAVAAATLFVVHPVHTEVVANIKSADELLALFFGVLAMCLLLKAMDLKKPILMIFSGIIFLLSCLAKENAITLLVIAPLTIWVSRNAKWKITITYCLPILLSAGIFILLRDWMTADLSHEALLSDPLNNPFLTWNGSQWVSFTFQERFFTCLITIWKYAGLLLIPVHLTHDYYPFTISPASISANMIWVLFFLLISVLIFSLWGVKKKYIWAYSVLFIMITISITLNVFFQIGTFMAERFLFLPSVGYCLLIAWLLFYYLGKKKIELPLISLLLICIPLMAATYIRNGAWKNNETLMLHDLKTSPESVRLQGSVGIMLLDSALVIKDQDLRENKLRESSLHLWKALELHPTYFDAYLAYGACSYYLGEYDHAVVAYERAKDLSPGDEKVRIGLIYSLRALGDDQLKKGNHDNAITAWKILYELDPDQATALKIAAAYEHLQQPSEKAAWDERAARFDAK